MSGSGLQGWKDILSHIRERYDHLGNREKQVFDVVLNTIQKNVTGMPTLHELSLSTNREAEMKAYIQYGQALLAVYRLVKRGIVPDPKIVEYLKDNLNPELAKQLAVSQSPSSPTSGSAPQDNSQSQQNKVWTRATLAQKLLRDSTNRFSRLVSLPPNESTGQQVNYAVRLENLRTLQQILSKKFLKHSLRSPEQIYNFIVTNDAVGTLSAVAGPTCAAAAQAVVDRKEEVLVKLAALMSEPGSKLLANKSMAPIPAKPLAKVPIFTALSNFRRHRFPAGRLRLAKTICLKDDMIDNGKMWLDHRSYKRHTYSNIAKQASHRITSLELKRQQEAEREQRERMRALREHNMDAYMALVKNVKNRRIQEILENTEKLLQDIGAKIQVERIQNEERRRIEAEKAAEKLRKREERKSVKAKSKADSKAAKVDVASEDKAAVPEEAESPPELNVADEGEDKKSYLTLSHRTNELVEQPKCMIGGRLMSYQLAGLDFLVSLYNNNLSGILADEMGLGKTIQTISLIAYLLEVKGNPGPHLIAVPLSTLPNWVSEFTKWCPSIKLLQYRGSKHERRDLNHEVKKCRYNVLLTTFEYILRERRILGNVKWRFIIVDEGHKMKNVKSKFHSTLGEFKSTHRLLLTGTPLQNNLNELWSLLNFLMPHTFSSSEDFERWFEEPFRDSGIYAGSSNTGGASGSNGSSEISLTEEEKLVVINRLHVVLRPFLLRRIKNDVLSDLPSKHEYVVNVPLSSWQEVLYEKMLNCGGNTLMELRKVVNHPYLFLDMYNIDENMIRVSGKLELLDRMLMKLLRYEENKVLIFSQMTSMMDILGDYFTYRDIKYHRLDGTIQLAEREQIMNEFNKSDSDVRIFILSTRAGGLGLNLQSANIVILYDSDWNPHADLQAQSRAHRVGQKNNVLVFRFITNSPIEQLILSKAQYKLNIDQQIIQAGTFNQKYNEQETQKKLKLLLSQRSLRDKSYKTTLTTPPQICKFIARNEHQQNKFIEMDKKLFGNHLYMSFEVDVEGDGEETGAETAADGAISEGIGSGVSERPTARRRKQSPSEVSSGGDWKAKNQDQVLKDNEKIKKILEMAGRLCTEDEIPQHVKDMPTTNQQENSFAEIAAAAAASDTRGVRKSRLRAQQLFSSRSGQNEEEEPAEEPRSRRRRRKTEADITPVVDDEVDEEADEEIDADEEDEQEEDSTPPVAQQQVDQPTVSGKRRGAASSRSSKKRKIG